MLLSQRLFSSYRSRHHSYKHLSSESKSGSSQHFLNFLFIEVFTFIQTTEVFQHYSHCQIEQKVRANHYTEYKVECTHIYIVGISYEVKHCSPAL